jgi:hypothetical protein
MPIVEKYSLMSAPACVASVISNAMNMVRISLVKFLIRIIKDFIFYIIMSNETGHFMKHTHHNVIKTKLLHH